MILQDYIDEVKLRLNRYNVVTSSNDISIMTYINDGRRNAQRISLPYVGQRYGKIMTISGGRFEAYAPTSIALPGSRMVVTYNVKLPDECVDVDSIVFVYATHGAEFRKEARRMDKEELYNLSLNNWTIPSIDRPTFTVEHILFGDAAMAGKNLIVAGASQADMENINVRIWYKAIIPDLSDPNESEQWLSPDFQELAIYYAMLSLVRDSKSTEHYQTISIVLNKMVSNLTGVYQLNEFQPGKELESNEAI